MRQALALCVALGYLTPTSALDVPQGSDRDNRIQHVSYNDGDVVVVSTMVGAGVRIVFAPNEAILDNPTGFPEGWSLTPRRNMLYIMPKAMVGEDQLRMPEPGAWDTNLMVTTNLRMYDFDLRLLAGDRTTVDDRVSYRVQFHYPNEEDRRIQAEIDEREAVKAMQATNAVLNTDYTMQAAEGSSNITPGMAYDDGIFTYMQFPANGEIPAVFLTNPDETETLVNSHVDPDSPGTLVVHRVAPEFVLRLGGATVGIYNESFSLDSPDMRSSSTNVPGVIRVPTEGGQ